LPLFLPAVSVQVFEEAGALNSRGLSYYENEENDKAIADFEAALRINPDYSIAKGNLETARQIPGSSS
jgi:tetratricopeptide (TPR) repeat protein